MSFQNDDDDENPVLTMEYCSCLQKIFLANVIDLKARDRLLFSSLVACCPSLKITSFAKGIALLIFHVLYHCIHLL
jgi:hypothetical protein